MTKFFEESAEDEYLSLDESISILHGYEDKVDWLMRLLLTKDEQFLFEKKTPRQATNKEIAAYLGWTTYRVKKTYKDIEARFRQFRKFLGCLPARDGAGLPDSRDRQG